MGSFPTLRASLSSPLHRDKTFKTSQRLHRAAVLCGPLRTFFFFKLCMVDGGFDVTHSPCSSCVLIWGHYGCADLVAHARCRCKFEQEGDLWRNLCAKEEFSAQTKSKYKRETLAHTWYLTVARLYSKSLDIPQPKHCVRNSLCLTAV